MNLSVRTVASIRLTTFSQFLLNAEGRPIRRYPRKYSGYDMEEDVKVREERGEMDMRVCVCVGSRSVNFARFGRCVLVWHRGRSHGMGNTGRASSSWPYEHGSLTNTSCHSMPPHNIGRVGGPVAAAAVAQADQGLARRIRRGGALGVCLQERVRACLCLRPGRAWEETCAYVLHVDAYTTHGQHVRVHTLDARGTDTINLTLSDTQKHRQAELLRGDARQHGRAGPALVVTDEQRRRRVC